jgi:hypothetical protein
MFHQAVGGDTFQRGLHLGGRTAPVAGRTGAE